MFALPRGTLITLTAIDASSDRVDRVDRVYIFLFE